ncbi:hypothetical protein PLICRDRAFT_660849 [Plicaturopsis crispa FD-325 SS-3]|nr:hypothetical protein PLICRDRAFT_660849 [Plicaturopsis crispa FD-325 SS-3]
MARDLEQLAADGVTPFSPPELVEHERRKILVEVERLEASILSLKSSWNALVPISKLSPEVLCEIFSWYRCTHEEDFPVKVTHVCKHWRATALAHARLWNRGLPAQNIDWTRELLVRSKGVPLVVDLKCYFQEDDHDRESAELVLSPVSRVGNLRVTGGWDSVSALLRGVSGPAPLLECLHLDCGSLGNAGSDYPPLPESFCSIMTPKLRRLFLSSCPLGVSLDSLSIENLSHLTLRHMSPFSGETIAQILNVLAKSPTVVELELGCHKCVPGDDAQTSSWQIDLPFLSSLKIGIPLWAWTRLARHISFPVSTTVDLCLARTQESAWELTVPLPISLPPSSSRDPRDPSASSYSTEVHGLWIVTGPRSCVQSWGAGSAVDFDAAPRMSVALDQRSDRDTAKFVADLCSKLQLTRCALADHVVMRGPRARPFLQGFIDALPAAALVVSSKTLETEANAEHFLPELRVIEIMEVNFGPTRGFLELGRLRDVLKTRADYGMPVETLRFTRCQRFGQADAYRFNGIVKVEY